MRNQIFFLFVEWREAAEASGLEAPHGCLPSLKAVKAPEHWACFKARDGQTPKHVQLGGERRRRRGGKRQMARCKMRRFQNKRACSVLTPLAWAQTLQGDGERRQMRSNMDSLVHTSVRDRCWTFSLTLPSSLQTIRKRGDFCRKCESWGGVEVLHSE